MPIIGAFALALYSGLALFTASALNLSPPNPQAGCVALPDRADGSHVQRCIPRYGKVLIRVERPDGHIVLEFERSPQ